MSKYVKEKLHCSVTNFWRCEEMWNDKHTQVTSEELFHCLCLVGGLTLSFSWDGIILIVNVGSNSQYAICHFSMRSFLREYFYHIWQKALSEGTTEDEMVGWHHWLDGHGFGWLWELVMDREAWRAAVRGVVKSRTWLTDWTDWLTELTDWLSVYHFLGPLWSHKQKIKEKVKEGLGKLSPFELLLVWEDLIFSSHMFEREAGVKSMLMLMEK